MNNKREFKLSPQGRITSAVSMAMVLPFISMTAFAGGIKPVGDTTVSQVGNVDVVNIANPNANGLSHNQYRKFNVSESGAVLNNSLTSGQSQLAGELEANSNLSGTASVILNEVVSKTPSLLLGQQEVFGMAADYVLANPNGITGNNIGFINTNRASLVVGKPTIAEEQLAGFSVGDRNNKTLELSGEVNGEQRLDLLAPKVDINGNITASEAINVITGRNNIDYDTLTVSDLERRQPRTTLDGQILGSMKSGRIRLHNTDAGATQTLQGQFNADTGFTAAADNLHVVDTDINAKTVALTGETALYIGGEVATAREDLPETKEKLADRVRLVNSGYHETESYQGSTVTGETVDVTGGDIDINGSQLMGTTITATGDSIELSGVVTTNSDSTTARREKGLWFNENEALDKSQQYHQSAIKASGDVNLSTTAAMNIVGAAIAGDNVALNSGNDLLATSDTTEQSHSDINRYKHETANLKSGARTLTQATQTNHQTSIIGNDVRVNSEGNQRLEGVALTAKTAELISGKDLTVANSNSTNRQTDEEDFKYWGGIGGGETHINNKLQTTLSGSQIKADEATLNAAGDVNISASGVAINNTLTASAAGDLNISHDFATEQHDVEDRHGTAFNITDKKFASNQVAQKTVASDLSAKEILLTGDNIVVSGSHLSATNGLSADANTALTTKAANATDITKTENYYITSEGTASSNIDLKDDVNNVLKQGVGGLLNGSVSKLIEKGVDQLTNLNVDASGSISGVTTLTTKGTGSATKSSLAANTVQMSAPEANVAGTQINAADEVAITGNQVTTGASDILTAAASVVVKSTGPKAYVRGGVTGIEVGVSMGHDQVIAEHNEYQAANTNITAGNTATLTATETLANQGTKLNAATVELVGQDIVNDASYSRIVDRDVVAGGDAALNVFAGKKPLIGGGISLSGEGIGQTTEAKTAHTTDIVATDTANLTATATAVDAGTQVTADSINISADDYTGTAVYNSTVTTTHDGRGDVKVDLSTSSLTDIVVDLGVDGKYQYQQVGDAKAVKGSLKANDVTIDATTRAVAAQDVVANQYHITAGEEARIGQDADKQWKTEGGAEAGVSGGVTIIPAAVTTGAGVLPSVAGKAGFNYLGVEDTQAKVADINANTVNVIAGQLAQIDGANLNSQTVSVKGNRANIAAAQDTHRAVGVLMGGNGGFAPDITSDALGAGAKLGVINETSNKANGATITTDSLVVAANEADDGLVIEGANIHADTISLSNANEQGNVAVIAAESKDKVGNFAIGANLSADVTAAETEDDSMAVDTNNIGAHLNVETDNSRYYALGTVSANNIDINSGNDIVLQSNINAGALIAAAGNELAINSAQDEVAKVAVTTELAVDGSPIKFVEDALAGDVLNALKDDFNNGTILGVSAAGKAGFDVNHQKHTQQASVQAGTLNASVGSDNIAVNAAKVSATESNLGDATVSSSNNNDFVHKVGASVTGKTFSVPEFVKTIPSLIKKAIAGNPVELPIEADVNIVWDETDSDNTQSDINL